MATLEVVGLDPETGAWEAAGFNMAVSTRKQMPFNLLIAMVVASKAAAERSVSGVTTTVMDR